MALSDIINKLLGIKSNIDLSQPIFYGQKFQQNHYDREIDEGMSSGVTRYVTLDVTSLSKKQLNNIITECVEKAQNFDLCKMVQVAGFTKENKRYLIVSGESHALFSGATKDAMQERLKPIIDSYALMYLNEFISAPVTVPYEPTNLGPYGSTGSPGFGISQHPDAQKLRDEKKIR